MNQNTRIAKQLVRIARMLVASLGTDYVSNVARHINKCLSSQLITGSSGNTYTIQLVNRGFHLEAGPGQTVPRGETIDEDNLKGMYNEAVLDARKNYYQINGYTAIEDNYCESLANHYMLKNLEFEVKDDDGDTISYTDEFVDEYENSAMEDTFGIINARCLVDEHDAWVNFFESDGTYTGTRQKLGENGFVTWK